MFKGSAWKKYGIIHFDNNTYSLEEVFNWLPINENNLSKNILRNLARNDKSIKLRGIFHGANVSRYSDRYNVFRNNYTCVCCGLKGLYFRIDSHEKDLINDLWHFNLYGINEQGEEILFTKDHIFPKAKGGKNTFDNYQTMCVVCNGIKKDKIDK